MKHKHYDLIIAWANGAEIQFLSSARGGWVDAPDPTWWADTIYLIKPEPKPYTHNHYRFNIHTRTLTEVLPGDVEVGDLWVTICGETGKLKRAEVLK
jgi:hypothetical protein